MGAIDYLKFLEPDHVVGAGFQVLETRQLYGDEHGIEYRCGVAQAEGRQEAVRFNDDLFLIAADTTPSPRNAQRQVVTESDWIHIQFRVRGGGHESVGDNGPVETAPYTCIIARYPEGAVVHRETEESAHFRAACLYLRPRVLRSLVGKPAAVSGGWDWLLEDVSDSAAAAVFPMSSQELGAINDLLACSYQSGVRRNYMYAKSLELLSHAVSRIGVEDSASRASLSPADLQRIGACRDLLVEHIGEQLTLAQLARRVGVNRSKLAIGFKSLYGLSVQAYWRELRLCRARDLLATDGMSVTEVAAAVGYADISSLTRAYYGWFGQLPRHAKAASN